MYNSCEFSVDWEQNYFVLFHFRLIISRMLTLELCITYNYLSKKVICHLQLIQRTCKEEPYNSYNRNTSKFKSCRSLLG